MDGDSRRVASFLSGAVTLEHRISPGSSYRVTYQSMDTHRSHEDGPARGGVFEPVTPTESVFDGHIDTLQARVDTDAGRFGLLSVGYELERETYVDASGSQGAAPESQVRLEQ
jgi:hypothetical protein